MRLNSISLRGITRFTDSEPVTIDFDSLGAGLVALVGPNGAGKSTLLEAPAAALYKSLPTRPGTLYDHAHGKDAFIEAVFSSKEHELRARIQIDAEHRKTEAYLFEDGNSLTTGRAAEFEAEVIRRFGSRELFLASVLAAQDKSGDFLRMARRDRKALFSELLGLSYLQTLHEAARDRRADAEKDLSVARAILESAERELTALPELEEQFASARTEAEEASQRLEIARAKETEAVSTLERARAAEGQLQIHETAFQATEREAEMATAALSEAEALPQRIEAQIRQRLAALDAQDSEMLVQRARERHDVGENACHVRRESLEGIVARLPAVEAAKRQVVELEAEFTKLEGSERKLTEFHAQETVARGRLVQAERALADAQKAQENERKRLERQAELLDEVPCTEQHQPFKFGTLASACPLLAEARGAKEELLSTEATRAQLETADVDAAKRSLKAIHTDTQGVSLACDPLRLEDIRTTTLPDARATASEELAIERAKRDLETVAKELAQLAQELERDLQEAFNARERISAERKEFARDRLVSLQEAAAKAAAANKTLNGALERRIKAEAMLRHTEALAQELQVSTCQQRHVEAEQARKRAERELREADQQLAGITARVEQLQERARSLQTYRDVTLSAETEVGDWSLLERALGRDGIQTLEIDAAGPEVARLTNELLEACYGPRFSISFETLREKKSARGEYSEAFDVRVFDGGQDRPVEALSGGEKVIVGESVGLAISIYSARKSGIRHETFFRDESAGALDPDNSARYVLMLRRARELARAHQIIFVAHQPDVIEAADVQIVVADGKVSIRGRQ